MSNALVNDLLAAAYMSGMRAPDQPSCHRTQLFFAVWSQRGRINATNDLQRALETATDVDAWFENDPTLGRGSGRYRLTLGGVDAIDHMRLPSQQLFPPAPIGTCRFSWRGNVAGQGFEVLSLDGTISV